MDPITLIVTALVAGTAKAAGDAIPDAYNGFKELIKRKFAGDAKSEMVLDEYEADPETYEGPLKKKLTEAGMDQDQEIIQAAEALLKELEPEAASGGKFQVTFQGEVKGAQIGDRNTQTNTFN